MTSSEGSRERPIVLLIAPRPVRRAMLSAFLDEWARSNGVSTLSVAAAPRGLAEAWCMAIVDVCCDDIEDEGPMACVHALRQNAPDLPIAILSDDGRAQSLATAVRLGLRAYIPTELSAPLACGALSLVLRGGDYFPPVTLLSRPVREVRPDAVAPSVFDTVMQAGLRG